MIGHELGGRYEILTRIGGGGMALVYKAQDLLLGRNVAVKILRQEFVHDEEFIRRFRREAQSAAALSHPNVVSIYDVGQEEDIHYIVMEYVEGQNLNEYIKEKAPLQAEEAIHIAMQICDALDHAHQNEIIHRDIKPHNILIGKNGRVKVTDFGIARAVTSSTITQAGSVLGSVHYFSPEHAKGVATGAKSDLYSLGIVLYQMLTARLPFLGESPISVALKHLQDEFEEPRVVNPMIPQSVENIILKSMRKNPQERYQSAKEMMADLDTCLSANRLHEKKIDFIDDAFIDEQKTRVIPAIKPDRVPPKKTAAPSTREVKDEAIEEEFETKEPKKKWVKPTIWVGATLLFLAVMLGVVLYVQKLVYVPEVTVPNLVKLTEEEARKQLTDLGISIEEPVTRVNKEGFAKGIVFEQSKPEGTKVKEGSSISISVSEGVPTFKMPDVTNKSYADARQMLIDLKVPENQITKVEENNDNVAAGIVFAQTPEFDTESDLTKVQVRLTVSKGKSAIPMPNLVGITEDEAKALIQSSGFKLAAESGGVKREPSYFPKGEVFKQWPYEPKEMAEPNSEVMIYVSSGYPPEAIEYTFNLPVAPVEDGKQSTIRIEYSDARGEKIDWGTQKISHVQTFAVDLVLAPNKDGVVNVYRNKEFLDSYPVSYFDAKNGTVQIPQIDVPATTDPTTDGSTTDEWTDGTVDTGNNGNGNGNGNGHGNGKDKKDKHNENN